jgi:DNA-binding transcriptional regulator GbsR (MarR family)
MHNHALAVRDAEERFILLWGEMAQVWGINKTMGQVHALLFVTQQPMSADSIMERLQISRGNASVTLRSLIEWDLVRRHHRPGERREYFVAEQDPVIIFRTILRERKKREFDPVYREVDRLWQAVGDGPEGGDFRSRLASFRELLFALNGAFALFDSGDLDSAAGVLKQELPSG